VLLWYEVPIVLNFLLFAPNPSMSLAGREALERGPSQAS